jgi:hypothetical protein
MERIKEYIIRIENYENKTLTQLFQEKKVL